MSLFLIVIPALLILVVILGVALFRDRPAAEPARVADAPRTPTRPKAVEPPPSEGTAHATETTEKVEASCYKLAFGISRFDSPVGGEHQAVLEEVAESIEESVHQRDYFPRRPMLLPKLMQALNDTASTRNDIARLILEDPTLAGGVLQRANSAFYRVSAEPVENVHRAVAILGIDGLRGLLAAAILQPVFRVPRGSFENFATITWEQAELTSSAAEKCAKVTPDVDPFVAQLLGLLTMLANIVLFRLTMDKYRDHPNLQPRAEVLVTAMQKHREHMAGLIASTWELTDISLRALKEQEDKLSPDKMSPLGRCVYFGELCGALATLNAHGKGTAEEALALLQAQGLDPNIGAALWNWTMERREK